jgi:hypothetical protein
MVEEQKNHNKVVVDDVEYAYDDMSENCKNQLKGVQAADRELARLNIAIALTKTARIAYMEAFTNDLPGPVTGEPLEDVGDD